MHPLTALLAAEHLDDLAREAKRARLSNELRVLLDPPNARVAPGGR